MSLDPNLEPSAAGEEAATASNGGDDVVTISRKALEALRRAAARVGAISSGSDSSATAEGAESGREAPEIVARREAREAALARELADRERKANEWHRALKEALRDRELATALAGKPVIAGASSQLLKLWREELDVYEHDGQFKVSARDGRSVEQAVSDWLSRPEYAHFCQPSSRGGAAVPGATRPAPTSASAMPRNLGEVALLRWQQEQAAVRSQSASGPVGLRPRR